MAKKQLALVEIEIEEQQTHTQNEAFLKNIKIALLLSLLEKGLLTKWQFDQCVNELKQTKTNSNKKVF